MTVISTTLPVASTLQAFFRRVLDRLGASGADGSLNVPAPVNLTASPDFEDSGRWHRRRLTPELIQLGRTAFRACFKQQLCGDGAPGAYSAGLARPRGIIVSIGAIIGCLEHRLIRQDEIIGAAARVARCKRQAVRLVLDELTGYDPTRHLWCVNNDGEYAILCVTGPNDDSYDPTRFPSELSPLLTSFVSS